MKTKRIGITLIFSLSLLLVWLLGSTTLPYVRAATYTVTNGNPAGPGSLRQVILDANASPGVDTISFQFPTNGPGMIVLTGTLPAITGDLILDGSGADYLAISGDNAHRILSITAGSQVTLSGLTLRDGYADNGGGIYNAGDLLLIDTYISDNTATQRGGGLYAVTGTTTLSNTYVISNVARARSGGICIKGNTARLKATGCIVQNNDYGGIYLDESQAELTSTQIISNGFTGIYIYNGDLILSSSQIVSNAFGLKSSDSVITLTQTQLSNQNESGIDVYGGQLHIAQSEIYNNLASYGGGGIRIENGTATILDTQIFSNTVLEGLGGGIYILQSSSVVISNTQIFSNTAAIYGGGISANRGTVAIVNSQIEDNVASSGGGLDLWSSNVHLTSTQLLHNSVDFLGGGISSVNGELHLNNTQVSNNLADAIGGIYLTNGELHLDNTQVNNNLAETLWGGILIEDTYSTFKDVQINYNTTLTELEGIGVNRELFTFANAYLLNNTDKAHYDNLYLLRNQTILGEGVEIGEHQSLSTTNALYINASTISNTSALTLLGHVRQEEDSTFYSNDHPLHIEGELALLGGDFYAPPDFILTGPFSHTSGTYYQTQVVNGSQDVGFPKEGGLLLNAQGQDLGSTQVAITAGEIWTGLGHSGMVRHYAAITPTNTTDQDATLTLYYQDTEIPPGQSCSLMEVYRYADSTGHLLTRDSDYGLDGRVCDSTPHALRVTGVQDFSTFVLHTLRLYPTLLPLLLRN